MLLDMLLFIIIFMNLPSAKAPSKGTEKVKLTGLTFLQVLQGVEIKSRKDVRIIQLLEFMQHTKKTFPLA